MDMKNLFPELEEIKNIDLQSKVAKSLEKAIDLGGWKEEDLSTIPFTLLIPELIGEGKAPKINIIDHIRAVTQMCKATYERYEMLGLGDKLNRDELIAAALLHDVGNVLDAVGFSEKAEYTYGDIGWDFWCNEGNPLPDRTIDLLKESTCSLFGAITSKPKDEAAKELIPELHDKGFVYFSPPIS